MKLTKRKCLGRLDWQQRWRGAVGKPDYTLDAEGSQQSQSHYEVNWSLKGGVLVAEAAAAVKGCGQGVQHSHHQCLTTTTCWCQ